MGDAYIEHLERDIDSAQERVEVLAERVAVGEQVEQRWIDDANQELARLKAELREAESDRELEAFADLERRKQGY